MYMRQYNRKSEKKPNPAQNGLKSPEKGEKSKSEHYICPNYLTNGRVLNL